MMMNWLKKLKSFLVLAFLFGFLFSATLTSCGNKNEAGENTEESVEDGQENSSEDKEEHPAGEEEHPNN